MTNFAILPTNQYLIDAQIQEGTGCSDEIGRITRFTEGPEFKDLISSLPLFTPPISYVHVHMNMHLS